jgi:hypothetical protein
MDKKGLCRMLMLGVVLVVVIGYATTALGQRGGGRGGGRGGEPPWAPPGSEPPPPVSAPEPTALSLVVVGAAGVAGYFLVRWKRKR